MAVKKDNLNEVLTLVILAVAFLIVTEVYFIVHPLKKEEK